MAFCGAQSISGFLLAFAETYVQRKGREGQGPQGSVSRFSVCRCGVKFHVFYLFAIGFDVNEISLCSGKQECTRRCVLFHCIRVKHFVCICEYLRIGGGFAEQNPPLDSIETKAEI